MRKESNLGIVEFKSVARGIIVTDEMLKKAEVNLVFATVLCPGKYLTIVEGELAAVERTVDTADRLGGMHVFSSFAVSSINMEIIDALSGKITRQIDDSIGIIESLQMANIINAADISLDSAEVRILDFRLARGCGVNSFYIVTGKLIAVEEAVRTAKVFLGEKGSLIAASVIANPEKEMLKFLDSAKCMC